MDILRREKRMDVKNHQKLEQTGIASKKFYFPEFNKLIIFFTFCSERACEKL